MIANIMAKLRSRIKFATDIRVSILCDDLATLLDIVEEVAAYDCPPDPEAGWGFCMYCAADTESEPHTPDCAYRRARELCGKDGAE